jgi:hypothetical protein
VRLELPQAILSVHETQPEGGVLSAAGANGRDAVGIAFDAHLAGRSADLQGAVGLRQHALAVDQEHGR